MASVGKMHMEVEIGPVMRTALDVLDLSADLAEALPDDQPEKLELIDRGRALIEVCELLLKVGKK